MPSGRGNIGQVSHADDDDLPEFLQNSPFLPIWDQTVGQAKRRGTAQKTVPIAQVVRSKPVRLIIMYGLICVMAAVAVFRSGHVVYDRLTGPSCYFQDPVAPDEHWKSTHDHDWSQYAYSLYATDVEYLCNAVVMFDKLRRYGSRAERLLLYAQSWRVDEPTREGRLLLKARDELGVTLQPVELLHEKSAAYSGPNWADAYTKLLAFNQTRYRRLVVLDSDAVLLDSLDDLFFVPAAAAVVPRAYWLGAPRLASHVMVLTPSTESFRAVQRAIDRQAGYGFYDMEVINAVFGRTCLLLPHQRIALLTGEFARSHHGPFLGSAAHGQDARHWSPGAVMDAARLVHFSDHPLPKPWVATEEEIRRARPDCDEDSAAPGHQCTARDIWLKLYVDFRETRAVSGTWLLARSLLLASCLLNF